MSELAVAPSQKTETEKKSSSITDRMRTRMAAAIKNGQLDEDVSQKASSESLPDFRAAASTDQAPQAEVAGPRVRDLRNGAGYVTYFPNEDYIDMGGVAKNGTTLILGTHSYENGGAKKANIYRIDHTPGSTKITQHALEGFPVSSAKTSWTSIYGMSSNGAYAVGDQSVGQPAGNMGLSVESSTPLLWSIDPKTGASRILYANLGNRDTLRGVAGNGTAIGYYDGFPSDTADPYIVRDGRQIALPKDKAPLVFPTSISEDASVITADTFDYNSRFNTTAYVYQRNPFSSYGIKTVTAPDAKNDFIGYVPPEDAKLFQREMGITAHSSRVGSKGQYEERLGLSTFSGYTVKEKDENGNYTGETYETYVQRAALARSVDDKAPQYLIGFKNARGRGVEVVPEYVAGYTMSGISGGFATTRDSNGLTVGQPVAPWLYSDSLKGGRPVDANDVFRAMGNAPGLKVYSINGLKEIGDETIVHAIGERGSRLQPITVKTAALKAQIEKTHAEMMARQYKSEI